MKNQYLVIFGLNGESSTNTYTICVDCEVQETAEYTFYYIIMEVVKKFNNLTNRNIISTDITTHSLSKLN